jgi:hypothetical protein
VNRRGSPHGWADDHERACIEAKITKERIEAERVLNVQGSHAVQFECRQFEFQLCQSSSKGVSSRFLDATRVLFAAFQSVGDLACTKCMVSNQNGQLACRKCGESRRKCGDGDAPSGPIWPHFRLARREARADTQRAGILVAA